MNNTELETLFKLKKYEDIIEKTKDSSDKIELTYRLSAFTSLGKVDEALDLIKSHRKIYEEVNLLNIMKLHFELLFFKQNFDEAYEEMVYYKNLPYANQETEEFLRDLPMLIRTEEKKTYINKQNTSEDLIKILMESDEEIDIMMAIQKAQQFNKDDFIKPMLTLISDKKRKLGSNVKTLALMYLCEVKYEEKVSFEKNGEKLELIPSKINIPFDNDNYKKFVERIGIVYKNPSVTNCALSLLDEYIIYRYPHDVIGVNDDALMIAMLKYATECFGVNEDFEKLLKSNNVSQEDMEKFYNEIKDYFELIGGENVNLS